MPLAQAFALYAAIQVRYGNTFRGPTYGEREMTEAVMKLPTTIKAASAAEAMRLLQDAIDLANAENDE